MTVANTDPRITRARRIGAEAVKRAAELKGDTSQNRSTATRAAYKIKAEALDAVLDALKPPTASSVRSARPSRSNAKSGLLPRPKSAAKKATARKR